VRGGIAPFLTSALGGDKDGMYISNETLKNAADTTQTKLSRLLKAVLQKSIGQLAFIVHYNTGHFI
jgi:hypothetical protein